MSDRKVDNRIVVGGVPRADLLPPEIKQQKVLRRQRRSLVALLILSIVLVVLAYGGATFLSQVAQANRDAANDRTAELLAEKAKFVEVSNITTEIANVESAQLIATSTEVDWMGYTSLVNGTLPSGMILSNVSIVAATPLAPLPATNGMQATAVGKLDIVAQTSDFGSIALWLEALEGLKGYSGAVLSSVTAGESGGFDVKVVLYVNTDALLNRFVETTDAEADDAGDEN